MYFLYVPYQKSHLLSPLLLFVFPSDVCIIPSYETDVTKDSLESLNVCRTSKIESSRTSSTSNFTALGNLSVANLSAFGPY